MNRVLILLVGFLVAPLISHAQPGTEVYRVGVLMYDGAPPGLLEAFRQGLNEFGYVDGHDVVVELRDAAGKKEQLGALAEDLVRLPVDVILAVNTPAAKAAKKATATIPIVITRVGNPVISGLVPSLAEPGGNITGTSLMHTELGAKRIELLREVLPDLARVVVMSNADNSSHAPQVAEMELASSRLGLGFLSLSVHGPEDLPKAFQVAVQARGEALFVLDDTSFTKHREKILELAAAHSLPVVSRYKDFADSGALIAYGPSLDAYYRRSAYYVDRILKGVKPSDLPIEQPTRFDLAVNLKTAKSLRLRIPPSLLIRADHIIE